MRSFNLKFLVLILISIFGVACAKVDPTVSLSPSLKNTSPSLWTGAWVGRTTSGSNSQILYNGSGPYALKGRISMNGPSAPPIMSASGTGSDSLAHTYNLRGTVHF